eukprot:764999-Hanusia_phi.AAC.1
MKAPRARKKPRRECWRRSTTQSECWRASQTPMTCWRLWSSGSRRCGWECLTRKKTGLEWERRAPRVASFAMEWLKPMHFQGRG